MKKKLLLINPTNQGRFGFSSTLVSKFQPLGLGILAAMTPRDWEVEIIDENFETFKIREDVDLVGLTAFTATINRAYELASLYRDRGIPTVLGGIHASMLPEEALQYVDSVVMGEAETAWPKVIEDFNAGELQKIYRGEWTDLSGLPQPRRDLFDPRYILASIQTTRGCPMNCEFCSVTAFNGARYRARPVEEVLDEMESIPQRYLFIVDDNIIGSNKAGRERAKALFQGMIDRKMRKLWFSQASLNFGEDEEALRLAARSGCRMVFLGIEAETKDGLKATNKRTNLHIGADRYEEYFQRIHKAGIAVLGSFVYFLESDTSESLEDRTRFVLRSGVDVIQTTYLTPLPGTRIFRRFKEEGRLLYTNFPRDWNLYDFTRLTFKPHQMDPGVLHPLREKIWPRLCCRRTVWRKTLQAFWRTRSFQAGAFAFMANVSYRTIALEIKRPNPALLLLASLFRLGSWLMRKKSPERLDQPSIATTRKPTLYTGWNDLYGSLKEDVEREGLSRHEPPRATLSLVEAGSSRPSKEL